MTRLRSTVLAGAVGATLVSGAAPALAAGNTPASPSPAAKPATLASAQQLLRQANADLTEARTHAATVRQQAADGVLDPSAPVAGITPFTIGSTDIEMIAGLMDPRDPSSVLGQASIEELSLVSDESADQPATKPVVVTTPKQAVAQANQNVALAAKRAAGARALVKQISNPGTADGPGAATLARLCGQAGVVIDQCRPVRWDEGHLQYDTVMIGRTVNVTWPQVKTVGGWRPSDPYPDHPSGRAADIMMPHGGQGSDVALGNTIAEYFQRHAREYGIEYMIWRQRQWTVDAPIDAWTPMSDRGSPTANHMDHVHITVRDGHSGTIFAELVRQAKGL